MPGSIKSFSLRIKPYVLNIGYNVGDPVRQVLKVRMITPTETSVPESYEHPLDSI